MLKDIRKIYRYKFRGKYEPAKICFVSMQRWFQLVTNDSACYYATSARVYFAQAFVCALAMALAYVTTPVTTGKRAIGGFSRDFTFVSDGTDGAWDPKNIDN